MAFRFSGRTGAYARLGGVLLSVAAMAAVAAVPIGMLTTSAAATWNGVEDKDLPQQVLNPVTDQVTRVYAKDAKTLIATFYDEDRHDVALGQIAPVMQQAIVAAEDARFFQHGGVDVKGVARAIVADAGSGSAGQGASTLTMQLVRNALKNDPSLTPAQRDAATESTVPRKVREAQYSVLLEKRLSKPEILRNYLNIAYFGGGAYGVDAAARRFFGVSPSKLSLAQAALIAGVVQSPDAYNPVDGDRKMARTRQEYVLNAMVKAGMITEPQRAAAAAEKLKFNSKVTKPGCTTTYGFFCDYLQRWWNKQPAFGKTAAKRDEALRRGGYTIVTTLDVEVQRVAEAQSRSVYSDTDARALPIAVVQPGTGKVLALAVNRRYGTDRKKGESVAPLITGGGSLHGYPSGSTFKMFTILAALQAGMPLNSEFNSPAKLTTSFPASGPASCGGFYCPSNANPSWMDGKRTMWDGFGRSVNTYFVHLIEQVGPGAAVRQAKNLGISFAAPSDAELAASPEQWGAFTLGVVATTPLELASAYAALGADGKYCAPVPVAAIKDRTGAAVPIADTCKQALPADVARAATDAARCPVSQQSAFGKCNGGTANQVGAIFGGNPVAGKTGSTENNSTETFVGFTSSAAAAGIAANPADPSDYVGEEVSGQVNAAVATTLRKAAGDSYAPFQPPSQRIAFGG